MRILNRLADLIVACLVGWWSPLLGLVLLYAIGRYLGWWVVGAMLVASGGWLWWASTRWLERIRPW